MNAIAQTAADLLRAGTPFVLATIVSRHGSTPRTAGTRMIVTGEMRALGTIGGGLMEARVLAKAREVLASGVPVLMPFDMTHSDVAGMDMICGGRLDVLLETVRPGTPAALAVDAWSRAALASDRDAYFLTLIRSDGGAVAGITHGVLQNGRLICGDLDLAGEAATAIVRECGRLKGLQTAGLEDGCLLIEPIFPAETVFLFGAGHVAQPTARLAKMVGFRVVVVDDRPEFADTARFPEADEIRVIPEFDRALSGLAIDRRGYLVIVTRGHLHDRSVLRQALRTPAAYIGMIGSRRKRDHIFDSLLKEGITAEDLKRVCSPIGLDIGAESCEEIGVSIVAELVAARARNRAA